jgi:hypothetical protein
MKAFIAITTIVAIAAVTSTGCDALVDPCPGQAVCDNSCMPVGDVCCGYGNGDYCPSNDVCVGNLCYPAGGSSCLSQGEETCANSDGTEDCAPIGADCCGNHKFCPAGTVCTNGGTSCSP